MCSCTKHSISSLVSCIVCLHHFVLYILLLYYKYPQDWKETVADRKWKEATINEMRDLRRNEAWALIPLPAGKKTVECKYICLVAKMNSIRVLISCPVIRMES